MSNELTIFGNRDRITVKRTGSHFQIPKGVYMEAIGIKGNFIEYKGKPLVRQGNEIFYGDMSDKYYLFLMIMNTVEDPSLGEKIPGKVMVQILSTDDHKLYENKQKVVDGLSEALELGTAWLDRANK